MAFGYSVWSIIIICIGVFVALFVDAIGGGGGLISVPVYLMAGLPTHLALGTNKLSSCLGTFASTGRYIKNGFIDWHLAIPSIVLAIFGSHIGTRLQLAVDDTILRYVLVAVLVPIAAIMIKKKDFPETSGEIKPLIRKTIVWVSAFVLGMYDGFYGPGTGTFLLLSFCFLAKLDLRTASGNVKVVNLSSNIGALATSLLAGKVVVPIGLIAAVFAFSGQFIGAGLMIKKGTRIVTPIIITVLSLLIIKTVLEIFGIKF